MEIPLLLLLAVVSATSFSIHNSFAGSFIASFESVDNREDMSRDYAEWHAAIRRVNKLEKTVTGWFKVKKEICQPYAIFESYKWSFGTFVKCALDSLTRMSLCDDELKSRFFYPVFEGNLTWTNGEKCSMYPGHMQMAKKTVFNLNDMVHKVLSRTLYGRFQVVSTIYDCNDNPVIGLTAVVIISSANTK